MDTALQARVERDKEIRARLFDWLDGKSATIDGMHGKLTHDMYSAIYPYKHIVSKLWWSASDADWLIDLTWDERQDAICRGAGLQFCRDCKQYCSHHNPYLDGLDCPCCEDFQAIANPPGWDVIDTSTD